jgi:hypothetical protein
MMTRSTFPVYLAQALGLTTLALATPAQAAILNGGFETGNFTGWFTFGDAGTPSIQTAAFGSGPSEGNYQALLETPPDDNYVALIQFLGITSAQLDALGYGEAFGGSAIKQTFTANAGDTLSFNWNFLTNESLPSSSNDFAFVVTLGSPTGLADTNAAFIPSNTIFSNETGFQTFSRILSIGGNYTLGIGIVNVADGEIGSGLLIDNVALTSGPTPAIPTPALLPSLIGMGIATLRKKRKASTTVVANRL